MTRPEIPGYDLLAPLGAGGMAVVYRARDRASGREVALKVLAPQRARDKAARAAFLREAILLSTLDHPNICRLVGSGELDAETFFVATELVRGRTLQELLRRELPPLARTVDIGLQAARGLAAAHDRGIVHRDVKPGNLMLAGERVKILDFGMAHLGLGGREPPPGEPLGTPGYAAPEEVEGAGVDPRSDLFALGVILFETIAGRSPFPGGSREETLRAVLTHRPTPLAEAAPHAPPRLADLVDRSLSRDPAERPQSARAVTDELEAVAARLPAGEPARGGAGRPRRAGQTATPGLLARLGSLLGRRRG